MNNTFKNNPPSFEELSQMNSKVILTKREYKLMKKACRKNRSHYLIDKHNRMTEVKKIRKKYIELETRREVICYDDFVKTQNMKAKNCSKSAVGQIMRKSLEKNESVNQMMRRIDEHHDAVEMLRNMQFHVQVL